jgi:shikimate kinase
MGVKAEMNNIILIGMPACGKSTIGVVLAKTMGKAFLDTDLLIQEREGDLLQNLINRFGHDRFIEMEEAALKSVKAENTVIATGGSVVYSKAGMEHLKGLGVIVYIKLSYDTIEKRLHNINSRGIAMEKGETLKGLYDKRIPLYERYSDITIDAENLSVEQAIEQIIRQLPQ